jgi:hypothetical protein
MREPTSYSRNVDQKLNGTPDNQEERNYLKKTAKSVFSSNWSWFWVVNSILFFTIIYLIEGAIVNSIKNTGIGLFIFAMLIMASSTFAGNTQAIPDVLVVDGIGAIDDMKVAKKRANNLFGPLLGIILGLVLYVLSTFLSSI